MVVPAHWGLAQRRAVFDCALLAGLTPLSVVSQPVALLAGGLLPASTPPLALSASEGSLLLMLDWGAGSCSAALFRRAADTFALVGVDGVDGARLLLLDALVAWA